MNTVCIAQNEVLKWVVRARKQVATVSDATRAAADRADDNYDGENDETRCIQTSADPLTAGNEAVIAEPSREMTVARVSRTLLVTSLSANRHSHRGA